MGSSSSRSRRESPPGNNPVITNDSAAQRAAQGGGGRGAPRGPVGPQPTAQQYGYQQHPGSYRMTYSSYQQYPAQRAPQQYHNAPPQLVAQPRQVNSDSVDMLKSGAAVKHNSVKIAPSNTPKVYTLTFVVDATVESICVVHLAVREYVKGGITLQPQGVPPLAPFPIGAGLGQQQSVTIDATNVLANLMRYDSAQPKSIPIAVKLSYDSPTGPTHSLQHYYCYLKIEGGVASMIKEILQVKDSAYELQHVFGGEVVEGSVRQAASPEAGEAAAATSGDDGGTCVVCLTEPKDTTCLPCRHMCMCKDCAEIVKRQNPLVCPICRSPIQQLLCMKH